MEQLFRAAGIFCFDEEGVSAIEYALLASLIAVVIFSSVTLFSEQLGTLYEHIQQCVSKPSEC